MSVEERLHWPPASAVLSLEDETPLYALVQKAEETEVYKICCCWSVSGGIRTRCLLPCQLSRAVHRCLQRAFLISDLVIARRFSSSSPTTASSTSIRPYLKPRDLTRPLEVARRPPDPHLLLRLQAGSLWCCRRSRSKDRFPVRSVLRPSASKTKIGYKHRS